MVKNWSKIVLVSMLVVAIAAPAFATTARVRSLANTGNYLSDDSNVFRWYSTLPSYANMVQAEVGTWQYSILTAAPEQFAPGDMVQDSRGLGFNYACGEDAKWGTYRLTLNENAVDHPGFYMVNDFIQMLSSGAMGTMDGTAAYPAPYSTTPVNKWDLAGGWEIGENFVLGAAYTRSSFKTKYTDQDGDATDDSSELKSSFSTYGVGVTWTNNEDILVDATFTLAMAGGEWENADTVGTGASTGEKWEWDKSTGIEFSARMFYDWKDYVTVVPLFQYAQAEYLLKQTPTAWVTEYNGHKRMGFLIGVAFDIEVNGSNTLIWATEYAYGKDEPSQLPSGVTDEGTMQSFPTFRLALESEITSWLTTRIGATHSNVSYKDKVTDAEYEWTDGAYVYDNGWFFSDNEFQWFLGAGFNVAEWTIDMELAPETPFSLGWWLHGYSAFSSSTYGPIARISGTYSF